MPFVKFHLQWRPFGSSGSIGRLAAGLIATNISRYLVADLSLLAVMVSTGLALHLCGVIGSLAGSRSRARRSALVIGLDDEPRQRYYRGCGMGL